MRTSTWLGRHAQGQRVFLFATVVLLLATACQSSSPGATRSVAVPTSTPLSGETYKRVFKDALLRKGDLPQGWSQVVYLNNDPGFADQLCGRIAALAYSSTATSFLTETHGLVLVLLYYPPGSAASLLAHDSTCANNPSQAQASVRIAPLGIHDLGDEVVAYETTGPDASGATSYSADVVVRRGDFVMLLSLGARTPLDAAEVQNLAGIADSRFATATAQ